jgi:hypothetical protein
MSGRSHGAQPVGERIGSQTGLHGHAAGVRDLFPRTMLPDGSSGSQAAVNDCLRSLNWMASSLGTAPQYESADCMQKETVARARRVTEEWKLGQDAPSGASALREILRGRSLYSADAPAVNVASFVSSRVSLPDNVIGRPSLLDLSRNSTRAKLDGDFEQVLYPVFEKS